MTSKLIILLTGCCLLLYACRNKNDDTAIADPAEIWFEYTITGKEGDDNITVMLQYRDGGEDGEGISIPVPGKVMLDGKILQPDSTRMNGAFYETHLPLAAFKGKHTIAYTGTDNKVYREEFDFQPVNLLTRLGDSIRRGDLVFEFEGLEPEDHMRILMTDTSFINNGINQVNTITNGRLVIARAELEGLANGPVLVEFIREYEKPVKNGTKSKGRMTLVYSLKREFLLRD